MVSDIEPGGIGTDRAEMDVLRHKLVAEKAINKHLKTRVEQLEDKLHHIRNRCRAYPRTVFVEPTKEMWAEANRVLDAAEGCPSLTAISGSNMRHVVEGIAALAETDEDKRRRTGD